jgi:hypothetical protein
MTKVGKKKQEELESVDEPEIHERLNVHHDSRPKTPPKPHHYEMVPSL